MFHIPRKKELNLETSLDARASYPNTWYSCDFFVYYEPYVLPTHVSLHTHNHIYATKHVSFNVCEFAPRHVLELQGLYTDDC